MRKILKETSSLNVLNNYYGMDFAFDIETTGLNPWEHDIVGLALYFSNGDAFYIVLKHTVEKWDGTTYLEYFVPMNEFRLIVSGLFNQTNVRMSAHNGKFDLRFLWRQDIDTKGDEFDTLLAGKLLDENRSNGLKSLAPLVGLTYDKYQNLKRYKGFDKNEILGSPLDEVAQYAMNDVEATYKLTELFTRQLKDTRVKNKFVDTTLWQVFQDLWMPLSRVLAEMEERGIEIDYRGAIPAKQQYQEVIDRHERLVKQVGMQMLANRDPLSLPDYYWRRFGKNDELDETKVIETDDGKKWYDSDGVLMPLFRPTERSNWHTLEFNLGSPKQLQDLIFKYTKIELPSEVKLLKNKDGTYKTDVKNIKTILYYMKDDPPEILKWILEWRKASKFVSTYLDTFIEKHDPDGRIHTYFNQAETDFGKGGTTTHRLSSSGPNFQNISAHGETGHLARSLVISRPPNVLICADYNMMELRMFAHYSEDQRMLRAFEEGRDLHIEMGAIIEKTSYEDLKARYDNGEEKAKEIRQLGKTSNFSLGFGMLAKAWQRFLLVELEYETTLEGAQDIIDAYGFAWEGLVGWRGKVHKQVRDLGYVSSLFGSVRRLPDAKSPNEYRRFRAERQAVSKIIQGSCAEVICYSMIPLQAALKGIGGQILLQVHDELVAEVPSRHADLGMHLMETIMTETCNPLLKVPMIVEAKAGYTWQEAKGK